MADGDGSRKRSSKYHFSLKRRSRAVAEPEQYKQFEEVLEQINPFGIFQLFACLCIVFAQIEWSGNLSFVSIVGSTETDWICEGYDASANNDGLNSSMPYPNTTEKCNEFKKCKNVFADKTNTTFKSIVASFKLVCDDKDKLETIQIIQAASLFIGSVIGGHICDWFGRQFGFYICQLGVAITSCMTIASTTWVSFAVVQFFNGILYGIIEVESIVLMMEFTNNQYRMIPNACFQTNIANIVIALIAFLTKDWQVYFVFLNLVTLPIAMAFMLWNESPRWLLVKGKINAACNVLNDLSDKRWNGTEVKFTPHNLELLPRDTSNTYYNFYHLFEKKRFAKQSLLQILSMITYAIVFVCYLNVIRRFNGSTILIVFLDGAIRLVIPVIIIVLDFKFKEFTRRLQFLLSLALIGICLLVTTIITIAGSKWYSAEVTVFITIAAMIAGWRLISNRFNLKTQVLITKDNSPQTTNNTSIIYSTSLAIMSSLKEIKQLSWADFKALCKENGVKVGGKNREVCTEELCAKLGTTVEKKKPKVDGLKILQSVSDGLKNIYEQKLYPLEEYYLFHEFYLPALNNPDFTAKPMILLVGQYSTDKTTFIRYLLEQNFPGMRIGPEPTTDRFTAMMYDKDEGSIPSNELVWKCISPGNGSTDDPEIKKHTERNDLKLVASEAIDKALIGGDYVCVDDKKKSSVRKCIPCKLTFNSETEYNRHFFNESHWVVSNKKPACKVCKIEFGVDEYNKLKHHQQDETHKRLVAEAKAKKAEEKSSKPTKVSLQEELKSGEQEVRERQKRDRESLFAESGISDALTGNEKGQLSQFAIKATGDEEAGTLRTLKLSNARPIGIVSAKMPKRAADTQSAVINEVAEKKKRRKH